MVSVPMILREKRGCNFLFIERFLNVIERKYLEVIFISNFQFATENDL